MIHDVFHGVHSIGACFVPDGAALGPAAGDIGGVKGTDELAFRRGPAVCDKVNLHKAGNGVVPTGK